MLFNLCGLLVNIQLSAGSGKTVLCSTVIDDSIKQAAYDQWSVDSNLGWHIMYFYFDAKDHNKTSLKNLVCSLLLQFSERSSTDREEILEWLHWGANQRQPGVEDLVSQLLLMLKDRGHTALILDALDECDDQKSLMRLLQAVYRTSSEVKVFLTSRREDVIEQGLGVLGATLRVDIAKHAVLEDIAQHIRERMKNDPNLARLSEASKKLIEERLITSANVT